MSKLVIPIFLLDRYPQIKIGIYSFCFTTVTQSQIGQIFCYTSRKQSQIGHLSP